MTEFKIEPASRIKRLPPYLFGRLNTLKLAKRQQTTSYYRVGMISSLTFRISPAGNIDGLQRVLVW